MRLREINLGCFGGGTGLPSLLGGLKRNPWLRLNAVVTMFDSGGSSGQLRDELGVLPPGDVLRCALALSRNEGEARRVLLARLPTLEHARLGGHTGGNLLLSMMERYSGDFLAAVDGLRALLGCRGSVWPISVEQATLCAEYADGEVTRGEVEVDQGHARGHHVTRVWLEPPAPIHPAVRERDREVRCRRHRPGQLLHEPDADAARRRRRRGDRRRARARSCRQQPADRRARACTVSRPPTKSPWVSQDDRPQGRRASIANQGQPSQEALERYAAEHKHPLPLGNLAPAPKRSSASSGDRKSRATIASGCRTRCGRCCRSGC